MKFNSQTTPLTLFSLLLTTCHVAQIHMFRLVAPMAVPTNLQIGKEYKRLDWKHQQREKRMNSHDKSHIDEKKNNRLDITVVLNTHCNI